MRDEITAQAKGAAHWVPEVDTVFEIGGQDSKYISLKNGEAVDFQMNKICAAGTGSFVEEQSARMDIPLAEFGPLALSAAHPAALGKRCTVFIETAAVPRFRATLTFTARPTNCCWTATPESAIPAKRRWACLLC